jgi:broad specificity phosphatase PhoE
VRHGEVFNPGGLVYADLPGFHLSSKGRRQAAAAADFLADSRATLVLTSPLERAAQTAQVIGERLGSVPVVDARLGEWSLSTRWAGAPWAELPELFPGELEAYLDDPSDLDFAPESLVDVAGRLLGVVEDPIVVAGHDVAVLVSHQDPIQALRLCLLGRPLQTLRDDPPAHASVITLDLTGTGWVEAALWSPDY